MGNLINTNPNSGFSPVIIRANINGGSTFSVDCLNSSFLVILTFLESNAGTTTNLILSNLANGARGIIKSQNISGAIKNLSLPNASGTVNPTIKNANGSITIVEFFYVDGLFSFQLWQ